MKKKKLKVCLIQSLFQNFKPLKIHFNNFSIKQNNVSGTKTNKKIKNFNFMHFCFQNHFYNLKHKKGIAKITLLTNAAYSKL